MKQLKVSDTAARHRMACKQYGNVCDVVSDAYKQGDGLEMMPRLMLNPVYFPRSTCHHGRYLSL